MTDEEMYALAEMGDAVTGEEVMDLLERIAALEADNAALVYGIGWMSGSPNFAPGGTAHAGFMKIIRPLLAQPRPGAALLERLAKLERVREAAELMRIVAMSEANDYIVPIDRFDALGDALKEAE